ncbi:cytochrome b [Vibrio brasiliensis]|uniref:cytochrome b n=1 Tax=Vibrio brasiliensis TaxID=170652 RepID=UPI001EFE2018|nr:cytochrome b/b6 domain-containing protein [Vibrio brasiliensis]MCG9725705.1 cytochrome b/b6 domain-containing protein [Vibrio brasiliensis]
MPNNKDKRNYSRTTRALHWLVAMLFTITLAIGISMVRFDITNDLIVLHVTFGVMLLCVSVFRLYRYYTNYNATNRQDGLVSSILISVSHNILLWMTIVIPITGIVFISQSMAQNDLMSDSSNLSLYYFSKAHKFLPYISVLLITMHFIGALKHEIIDKDSSLSKMFGLK